LLKGDPKAKALLAESRKMVKAKLDPLEERLHNPKAEVAYDVLAMKGGAQLYSQLAWYFELIKDADGAPTQGVKDVYAEASAKLLACEIDWAAFVRDDLSKLNEMAKKLELPIVIVPPVRPPATDARPAETRKAQRWGR
jgi:hypothetical protein